MFHTSEPVPDEESSLKPARRRHVKRLIVPLGADERAAFLDNLALRTTPSFDFFLFSLLAGAVLGLGLMLDSPAVLVLGAVIAPFMGPLVGLSLATVLGSARFFLQVLAGTAVGSLLVFAGGALAGFTTRVWPGQAFLQADLHAHFTWPDLVVLALGILLVSISMVRSEQRPLLPSALVAYSLYIPVAVAGVGLTSGETHFLRDGLGIFAIYLACSVLIGILTLALQGFHPLSLFGYTLGTTILLISIIALVGMSGMGTLMVDRLAAAATPIPTVEVSTSTVTPTFPSTATEVTPQASETPTPPQPTRTPTHTLVPSTTSTITLTPAPTPVWAIVNAEKGVFIRAEPSSSGKVVAGIDKGGLVMVLPETVKVGLTTWVHVLTPEGIEGWVIQQVLLTATPAPGW